MPAPDVERGAATNGVVRVPEGLFDQGQEGEEFGFLFVFLLLLFKSSRRWGCFQRLGLGWAQLGGLRREGFCWKGEHLGVLVLLE